MVSIFFLWAIAQAATSAGSITDECSFIRRGLDALPPSGGEFVIPAGHYTCSYPIVLDRDGLKLRGQGRVTLKLADNTNSPVILMGDTNTPPKQIYNLSVSDLILDGNRAHQQSECWGGSCDAGGTSFIRNNGITIRAVTYGTIRNISVVSPRSGGVVSEKNVVGMKIDGLSVTDSEFDGFAGYETTLSEIKNLYFHNNRAAGISIDIRFQGNTFRNARIENTGDVGIFMRDSNDNLFENFWIVGSGNHGLFVASEGHEGTCPSNNEFRNFTVENSRFAGFRLNDACERNRLTGTTVFRHNPSGCLSESARGLLAIEGSFICEE